MIPRGRGNVHSSSTSDFFTRLGLQQISPSEATPKRRTPDVCDGKHSLDKPSLRMRACSCGWPFKIECEPSYRPIDSNAFTVRLMPCD